jgi:hypothetical protein
MVTRLRSPGITFIMTGSAGYIVDQIFHCQPYKIRLIPISVLAFTWPDTNPHSTALKMSMLTIIPPMWSHFTKNSLWSDNKIIIHRWNRPDILIKLKMEINDILKPVSSRVSIYACNYMVHFYLIFFYIKSFSMTKHFELHGA